MSHTEQPDNKTPDEKTEDQNAGAREDTASEEASAPEGQEVEAAESEGENAGEEENDEPVEVDPEHLRLLEAILFSAVEPVSEETISERMPEDAPVKACLKELGRAYEGRGVVLALAGGRWFFRTADDLSEKLRVHMQVPRRLSRAAMETLAIVAYHQPITRAEIEEIRGVGLSKGTLDSLMEQGWIGPRGRRRTAGRPVTWGTTQMFLTTFGLDAIGDLPGLEDLKAAGLLDKRPAIQITDVQDRDDDDEDDEEDEPLDIEMSESSDWTDDETGSEDDSDEESGDEERFDEETSGDHGKGPANDDDPNRTGG